MNKTVIISFFVLFSFFTVFVKGQENDLINKNTENEIDFLQRKMNQRNLKQSEIEEALKKRNQSKQNIVEDTVQPIEKELNRRMKTDSLSSFFGYDIFNGSINSFEPYDFGVVDQDYLIGPYDELFLYLWGEVEMKHKLTVNRDGKIFIPDVGPVYINGLTIAQGKLRIQECLSSVYSGLKSNRIMFDLSIGKLRKIKIFLLGNVFHPGGYTLSSVSTVFHGLYYSGGPSYKGSMRNIMVKRNGKTIEFFDLYDYLLEGDNSKDIRLQNGDVIFVPYVKKRVFIQGGIVKPAAYELTYTDSLFELLKFSGGLLPEAFTGSIQIKRIEENAGITLINHSLVGLKDNIELFNGDTITVKNVLKQADNYVQISGEVLMPGIYEYKNEMDVNDLIIEAGGLLNTSYKSSIEVSRIPLDNTIDSLHVYSVEWINGQFEKFKLLPFDIIYIRKDPGFVTQKKVKIYGEVFFPGEYSLMNSHEELSNLIDRAGGLKKSAFIQGIRFFRKDVGKIDIHIHSKEWEDDIILKENDSIYIPNAPATVKVYGEVFFPTNLKYEPDKMLSDYIDRAGGFTDQANKKKVIVTMANGRVIKQNSFLGKKKNIVITPGATIFVPQKTEQKTDWKQTIQNVTSVISSVAMTIFLIQNIK